MKLSSILAIAVLSLAAALPSPALAADSLPILRLDVTFLLLDQTHEQYGQLDQKRLAEEIAQKQIALAQSGAARLYRRFSLTTVPNESAMVQMGREVTITTGQQQIQGRQIRSTGRQSLGSLFRSECRIQGDSVVLEMDFETSYRVSEEADSPPEVRTLTAQSTTAIKTGVPTLVYDAAQDGDVQSRALCLVTATIEGTLKATGENGRAEADKEAEAGKETEAGETELGDAASAKSRAVLFERYVTSFFQRYDKDGNGVVEQSELGEGKRIASFDADQDGKVTKSEISEYLNRQFRERNRSNRGAAK